MILPSVNVRANTMVVDVGIAPLRHAFQRGVHRIHGSVDRRKKIFQLLCLSALSGIQASVKHGQPRRRVPLDIHVNEDEPFLVDAAQEVLNQADVAAFDFAQRVSPEEVMQRVTAVAENRRPAEPLRDCMPGNSNSRRQYRGGPCAAPYVSVTKVAEQQHGSLPFAVAADRVIWKRRQIFESLSSMVGSE